jgi:prepilin-type N-terminal cleavage/methylation domain-containing protein
MSSNIVNQIKNESGFTLIEVMVASAIFVITALMIGSIYTNMTIASIHAESRVSVSAVSQELRGILQNKLMCTANLSGKSNTNGTVLNINDKFLAGASHGNMITIHSVLLKTIVGVNGSYYRAEVELVGRKKGHLIFQENDTSFDIPAGEDRKNYFVVRVPVYYVVTAANIIDSCVVISFGAQEICESAGGVYTGGVCDFCPSLGATLNIATNECEVRTIIDTGSSGCVNVSKNSSTGTRETLAKTAAEHANFNLNDLLRTYPGSVSEADLVTIRAMTTDDYFRANRLCTVLYDNGILGEKEESCLLSINVGNVAINMTRHLFRFAQGDISCGVGECESIGGYRYRIREGADVRVCVSP